MNFVWRVAKYGAHVNGDSCSAPREVVREQRNQTGPVGRFMRLFLDEASLGFVNSFDRATASNQRWTAIIDTAGRGKAQQVFAQALQNSSKAPLPGRLPPCAEVTLPLLHLHGAFLILVNRRFSRSDRGKKSSPR